MSDTRSENHGLMLNSISA